MIRVTHNGKDVARQLKATESAARSALRRTINRMVLATKTLTLQRLSAETGLTQKRLREYVTSDNADYVSLSGAVRVRPHTFNIASFNGRQTRKGVSSAAWGTRKIYPHTFLIQGGKTAMVRVGKARLPIRPVYGPRIHAEFVKIDDELSLNVQARFRPTLKHELNYALGRIGLKV